MDQTSLGRRIPDKSTAFVAIFIERTMYCTSAIGPVRKDSFSLSLIKVIRVRAKYISLSKEYVLKYRKIPSAEGYKIINYILYFHVHGLLWKHQSQEFSSVKYIFSK